MNAEKNYEQMTKFETAYNKIKSNCTICNCAHFVCDVCIIRCSLEALEKQLPKKPKESVKWRTSYYCTNCGRGVEKEYHRYCPRCGQRLDWGEEK